MKKKMIIFVIVFIVVIVILSSIYVSENSLDDKTIVFLGDSIMSGYGNEDRGFEYYLEPYLKNTSLKNVARGGSTLTQNTGTDDIVIKNQIDKIEDEPDIIVFNGGINDIMGYDVGFLEKSKRLEIGTIDPETKEISDSNTVYGDFEDTVKYMKEKYPKAKIYFLSILLLDETTISNITVDSLARTNIAQRRDEFFSQAKLFSEKMGITYIDLSHIFVGHDEQYRQPDWIHMSDVGYKQFAAFLLKELKK